MLQWPTQDMLAARAAACGVDCEEFERAVIAQRARFGWIVDHDRWNRVLLVNIQLWLQKRKVASSAILDIVTRN